MIANGVSTVLLGHALHQSFVEDGQDEEGGHHPGQQEVEGAVDPGGAAGQGRSPPLREDIDQAFRHQAENSQKRYTHLGVKDKRLKVLKITLDSLGFLFCLVFLFTSESLHHTF